MMIEHTNNIYHVCNFYSRYASKDPDGFGGNTFWRLVLFVYCQWDFKNLKKWKLVSLGQFQLMKGMQKLEYKGLLKLIKIINWRMHHVTISSTEWASPIVQSASMLQLANHGVPYKEHQSAGSWLAELNETRSNNMWTTKCIMKQQLNSMNR